MLRTSFQKKLLVVSLLAASACGRAPESVSDTKVVGGTPVESGAFGAVVGIAVGKAGDAEFTATCTGTLIAPAVVLTAGHCVEGSDEIVVFTGDGKDDARIPVASAHAVIAKSVHESLRRYPLGYADYALLTLAAPLAGVTPLPWTSTLAGRLAAERRGTTLLVGYGRREDGRAGRKFQADAKIQSVTPAEAVVGGDGKDACAGDSGGPALTKREDGSYALFGVVSRGLGLDCGKGGYVGLTSDVACWIARTADLPLPEDCSTGSPAAERAANRRRITAALGFTSWKEAQLKLREARDLVLDGAHLTDLSPLAGFTQLESLSVKGNRLVSIAPLKNFPRLKTLKIDGNDVADLDALSTREAEGLLVFGKRRQLSNHFATDFLEQCLDPKTAEAPRLTIKAVFYTTMTESCDKANERLLLLSTLRLRDRPLTDVTPLAGLENLKKLDLTNTDVTDLEPLAPLVARGLVITGVTP